MMLHAATMSTGGILMGDIHDMQTEHQRWLNHNFPDQPSYQPLLGIGEEVGELMHAHLKAEQNIRNVGDAAKVDALGDIFIYMLSYANTVDLDLESCILRAWNEVKVRDWVAYPEAGVP